MCTTRQMKLVVWGDVRILLCVCVCVCVCVCTDLLAGGQERTRCGYGFSCTWTWIAGYEVPRYVNVCSQGHCTLRTAIYHYPQYVIFLTLRDQLSHQFDRRGEIIWRFAIFTALKLLLFSLWWVYVEERRWLAKCKRNSLHPPRTPVWRHYILWTWGGIATR